MYALTLAVLLDWTTSAIAIVATPFIVKSSVLGGSNADVGYSFAFFRLTALFVIPVAGRAADLFGRRSTLAFVVGCGAVGGTISLHFSTYSASIVFVKLKIQIIFAIPNLRAPGFGIVLFCPNLPWFFFWQSVAGISACNQQIFRYHSIFHSRIKNNISFEFGFCVVN